LSGKGVEEAEGHRSLVELLDAGENRRFLGPFDCSKTVVSDQ
jgi:hypothetical protein